MRTNYAQIQEGVHVGDQVTCQIGNSFDTSGYREHVMVEVLEVRQHFSQRIFLVREVGQEFLGSAIVYPHGETQGLLYCTNARTYGAQAQHGTGILTEDQARRSLGF